MVSTHISVRIAVPASTAYVAMFMPVSTSRLHVAFMVVISAWAEHKNIAGVDFHCQVTAGFHNDRHNSCPGVICRDVINYGLWQVCYFQCISR